MTADADRNRRVGDVERPEMIRPPVHVDEIDDRSDDDAIDEVAGGAADDERQPDARHDLMARQAGRVDADADERRRSRSARSATVLNGKSDALRMPNAAPVFRTCVKSTKPGMTVTLACSGNVDRTIAFVS